MTILFKLKSRNKSESEIDDVLQSIYATIKSNIQKSLGKCSGWIVDFVIGHTISISNNNPLPGSSYINLSTEIIYSKYWQ